MGLNTSSPELLFNCDQLSVAHIIAPGEDYHSKSDLITLFLYHTRWALARLGPAAEPAEPRMIRLLSAPNSAVQASAIEVLMNIETLPKLAPKTKPPLSLARAQHSGPGRHGSCPHVPSDPFKRVIRVLCLHYQRVP